MTTGITYCMDKPLLTTTSNWLNTHIGRIAVGRRTGKKRELEILAYSDDEADSVELSNMAKQQGVLFIRSIDSEGVTAID